MTSNLFLVEPFYSGSHAQWARDIQRFSEHNVHLFTLPGRNWKWRMASSAIPLAEQINQSSVSPDVILVSGMMDLPLFKSLLSADLQQIPIILYLHETQLTYPWNEPDHRNRDRQYAWRNLTSMLVADEVVFNSSYHQEVVFEAIPTFLSAFPEQGYQTSFESILHKSKVISPGVDMDAIRAQPRVKSALPVILWNHRWEHDKNPESFLHLLQELKREGEAFQLIVCGEHFQHQPEAFESIRTEFEHEIIHWGYAESREQYLQLLRSSHVLPVTSNQEFFGLSVLEAIVAGVHPVLPNRLSYPSIYRDLNVFYGSFVEFLSQTKEALRQPAAYQLPSQLDQYNWKNLIKKYDSLGLKTE
ncbi:MAG: DUF3524 domain-containing protein [Bacteroidetes bacterium]|nr:DUF3524 domain-containing protein [Bacteroidota bacterium]